MADLAFAVALSMVNNETVSISPSTGSRREKPTVSKYGSTLNGSPPQSQRLTIADVSQWSAICKGFVSKLVWHTTASSACVTPRPRRKKWAGYCQPLHE